ncbi:putative bifunctional diguanylate cyclase/phosphodiesterase [Terracidiphilus sp.]|jgi:diguanylate cyclase (GGDEF)-like protein|uniref:putative bifunctional diguanylate cyclase/phosphodiesterase n=1 Tax=Terracidiphilus sp. TaxID=1964191 RepID=UPI003C1DDF57
MMTGVYNPWLVFASVLIAMLASFTALDMAGRIAGAQGQSSKWWWLAGGSVAMGIGIWSMHFVGMLAFSLPVPMGYDPWITALSLAIAIALSAFALWRVCFATMSWMRLAGSAVLMGSGVCAMHYTGMAAMRMSPSIEYDPRLFAASVAIAMAASGAALWIAIHLRTNGKLVWLMRCGAAVVMGLAIAGMHYTGMAAARFPMGSVCTMDHPGMDTAWIAPALIVFTLAVLAIALVTSVLDFRMESRTAILASSLASANQTLQFMALHDSLTKLPNRLLLEDKLDNKMEAVRAEGGRFAVLFVDLDGFKQVNDAYGHHVGDLLLVEVAQRIRVTVPAHDMTARVGGDEFVLTADTRTPQDAANLAERLLGVLREPIPAAGTLCLVSASIGIAFYDGGETEREDLLKNADAAMYHAKAMGRNTYCFFDDSMNADVQKQMKTLRDLRQALERHELVMHYQPKLSTESGTIMGVEALMRWNHPERGLLLPGEFIPLAERIGLIVPMGEWAINESCRQMSLWCSQGLCHWTVAVNLSPVQFNHPGLVGAVRRSLEKYALDSRHLMLEITETTAMHNPEASLAILNELQRMGVKISIDDFGTGYSSLMYLKRLPASELKIDRGFVRDLTRDTEDAAIISAIVALGKTLDLSIVAEGVENEEQLAFLSDLGCNTLQGYLIGKPVPPEELLSACMYNDELRKVS